MKDRIVQIVAVVVGIASIAVAGGLLPTIVEKAGQDHLVLVPVDPETLQPIADEEPVQVFTSLVRRMSTVDAIDDEMEMEVGYDAGLKTWEGSLGDIVEVTWRDGGETRTITGLLEGRDGYGLRYTDSSVEGAPPIVALGTAIGALRGVIVDYLWLKVNMMKEEGQFYEVMSDAELITQLQPRFAQVWGFHGHNMAYNISVMTNTPEERWDWVTAGIDLVRNQGIRYNPNDVVLHKDLAFWFAHKIDGNSDDAHFHYKKQFAEEWHLLLGPPPFDHEERIEWIKTLAEAPASLEEAEARVPGTQAVVDDLEAALENQGPKYRLSLDRDFLLTLGRWLAVKNSSYARILGLDPTFKANDPVYAAIDTVMSDPQRRAAVLNFLAYLRAKVLREDYNMNPGVMYEFTRDIGPLDWRHAQAHALYWARLGTERGAKRYEGVEDVHKVINNDRIWLQAMQALARSGLGVRPVAVFHRAVSRHPPRRLEETRAHVPERRPPVALRRLPGQDQRGAVRVGSRRARMPARTPGGHRRRRRRPGLFRRRGVDVRVQVDGRRPRHAVRRQSGAPQGGGGAGRRRRSIRRGGARREPRRQRRRQAAHVRQEILLQRVHGRGQAGGYRPVPGSPRGDPPMG